MHIEVFNAGQTDSWGCSFFWLLLSTCVWLLPLLSVMTCLQVVECHDIFASC